jgi:hypothetical protein
MDVFLVAVRADKLTRMLELGEPLQFSHIYEWPFLVEIVVAMCPYL